MEIIKSPNDKNIYKYIILKNNLKLLLIQDELCDIDCVALTVNTGYADDTIPGMAHFLEHMLFNGTKLHPQDDMFMNYISQNGGYTNAHTTHNNTCYYYTVSTDKLNESIELFSEFFISPLLAKDSILREIKAVNSEHVKNINSDQWRTNDILRKAYKHEHPLSKFGTGMDKTLGQPDIDVQVVDFFNSHYSADLMTVVVLTKKTIAEIQNKMINTFEGILVKPTIKKFKNNGKMFAEPKIIKMSPIQDITKLILYWDIKSFSDFPLESPIFFILHILGNESDNSLFSHLIEKEFITELNASQTIQFDDRCVISLDLSLTDYGFKEIDYILSFVNTYISFLIQNVDKLHYIYNELQIINAFNFKYLIKKSSEDTVTDLCSELSNYKGDIKNILLHSYASSEYKHVKNNIIDVLTDLNVNNSVIILCSKIYENYDFKVTDEYGIKYLINKFTHVQNIDFKFSLLTKNKFISQKEIIFKDNFKYPVLLDLNLKNIKSYWFPSTIYNSINVCVYIKIDVPLSLNDCETNMTLILYLNTILQEINNKKYMGHSADYGISLNMINGKIYIIIFGNVNKIYSVCKLIIKSIINVNNFTEKSFYITRTSLIQSDMSMIYNPPYKKIGVIFNKIMNSNYYDNIDRLNIIHSISYDEVKHVFFEILKMINITMIVSGNINNKLAIKITNLVSNLNKYQKYTFDKDFYNKHKLIDTCETIYDYSNLNKSEQNVCVNYFIYIANRSDKDWMKISCILNIIDKIIGPHFFNTLRTKEKFGYVVNSGIKNAGDKLFQTKYYSFIVQSQEFTKTQIIERITKYISEFTINSLSDETFADIVNSFVELLQAPFSNIYEHTMFIFDEIIEMEYDNFDLKQIFIKTYKNITVDDVKIFYNTYFIKDKKYIVVSI
jgi:insulysin